MNYLREINAFWAWKETHGVCPSCILLWYALMSTANKAGWPDQFTVPISVLEMKTGLKRQTICDARKKLEKVGRIKWTSRKGNQCAIYEIISCDTIRYDDEEIDTEELIQPPIQSPTQPQTQYPTQSPTQPQTQYPTQTPTQPHTQYPTQTQTQSHTQYPTQSHTQYPTQSHTINKLNDTKQDETKQDETNSSLLCQSKLNPKSASPAKKISIPMKTYGDFDNVKLTDEEHEKLIAKFGEDGCKEHICKLSEYIASKNVRYQSHYATILSWSRKESTVREEPYVLKERTITKRDRPTSDLSKFCPIDF